MAGDSELDLPERRQRLVEKALEQFSDPVREGYERIQPTHLRIWAHDIREREGYESILVAFLLRMADRFDDARAAIEEEEK